VQQVTKKKNVASGTAGLVNNTFERRAGATIVGRRRFQRVFRVTQKTDFNNAVRRPYNVL